MFVHVYWGKYIVLFTISSFKGIPHSSTLPYNVIVRQRLHSDRDHIAEHEAHGLIRASVVTMPTPPPSLLYRRRLRRVRRACALSRVDTFFRSLVLSEMSAILSVKLTQMCESVSANLTSRSAFILGKTKTSKGK